SWPGPASGERPDVVILIGTCGGSTVLSQDVFSYSFGFATKDGTQRCLLGGEADNAAAGTPFQAIRNDYAGGQVSVSDGTLTYGLLVCDFDIAGLSVTRSASAGSDYIAYLALRRLCSLQTHLAGL